MHTTTTFASRCNDMTLEELNSNLSSSNWRARYEALDGLAIRGNEASTQLLASVINILESRNEEPFTLQIAAKICAAIGPDAKSALPALSTLVDGEDYLYQKDHRFKTAQEVAQGAIDKIRADVA